MKKIVLFIFILFGISVNAQEEENIEFKTDTTPVKVRKPLFKKGHDPAKAAFLSAVLPGAGQIYNKKYWKLPIVYVGLGGLSALVGYSATEWQGFTNAYRQEVNRDSTSTAVYSYRGFSGENQLLVKRRQFKRTLDIAAIALTAYYLLQIVDATVDAHLMDFDVNGDISVSILPDFEYRSRDNFSFTNSFYAGVKLKINIK